jgi:hypothetical protein
LLAKRFIDGNINNASCSTTFRDPTQFVLDRLREIGFRTAVATAAVVDPVLLFGNAELAQQELSHAQKWTQNVDVNGQVRFVTYTANVPYMICAVIFSLLAVVAILPLYWDTRNDMLVPISFNPLNVAHVFDAPVLLDAYGDMETYIQKEGGLKRVQYSTQGSDDGGLVRVMTEG